MTKSNYTISSIRYLAYTLGGIFSLVNLASGEPTSPIVTAMPPNLVTQPSATVYQVTQPSGQVSMTDNIDKAYQLSGGNTQNIKVLDTLTAPNQNAIVPSEQTNSTATPASSTTSNAPVTTTTQLSVQTTTLPPMPISPETLPTKLTKASQKGDYRLRILAPANNMVYHRPVQPIDINVRVSPILQPGDSITYTIDGKKIAQTQNLTLTIDSTEIPLDKHTLRVEVMNILSQPIASAETEFYVVQNTIAIKKRRQLEQLKEQLEAYDDLPWYQKLAVRLGIQKK